MFGKRPKKKGSDLKVDLANGFRLLEENEYAVLGEPYKHAITGFEGLATCRSEYVNGYVRVVLTAINTGADTDVKEYVFDEQELTTTKPSPKAATSPVPKPATSGGEMVRQVKRDTTITESTTREPAPPRRSIR